MGRKFKELKVRLQNCKTRELLVVDDHKIRTAYFRDIQKIISKIEKLEKKEKAFHDTDQNFEVESSNDGRYNLKFVYHSNRKEHL